jgi:signal transduction histidine kinase
MGNQQSGPTELHGLLLPESGAELASSAVLTIGPQQKITSCSDDAAHLLGLDLSQLTNQTLRRVPEPLRRAIRQTITSGKAIQKRDVEFTTPAGQKKAVRLSTVPGRKGRKPGPLTVVLQDLSVITRHERSLRWLDRLASLGSLSTTMAHEIKNALVAVKTFLDLLAEKHQDTELAEVARREIRRIESIVGTVLNYAAPRPRAAGIVRLHEVIEHTLKLARPRIEGKPLQVIQRFRAASDFVKADEHQLQQVFLNLILNALDAMGARGTLTISTATVSAAGGEWPLELGKGGGLRVTIHDSGAGMSADARRRLFEPFFTTKPAGTGLGLSITRGILKEHGGGIELDCATGVGTTFHVFLPEYKRTAHAASHPRSHTGRGE